MVQETLEVPLVLLLFQQRRPACQVETVLSQHARLPKVRNFAVQSHFSQFHHHCTIALHGEQTYVALNNFDQIFCCVGS